MKANIKGVGDIANIQNLRMPSWARRSSKPPLPTTAILAMNMANNERKHLLKLRVRLLGQKAQIDRRLPEIEKELDELLLQAQKKVVEMRGEPGLPMEIQMKKEGRGRPKMILEY